MSLTHTNTTLSTTYDSTEVDTNFSETRAKFGSIVNSDLDTNAGISVTKLAASNQEILVNLTATQAHVASGWPAASASTPIVWVPVPGDDTDDSLTVVDCVFWCDDIGAGTGAFKVDWGNYTGGAWTQNNAVIASTTIAAVGNPSLSTTTLAFHASDLRGFGLFSTVVDATALAGGTFSSLSISLLCKRVIQG